MYELMATRESNFQTKPHAARNQLGPDDYQHQAGQLLGHLLADECPENHMQDGSDSSISFFSSEGKDKHSPVPSIGNT